MPIDNGERQHVLRDLAHHADDAVRPDATILMHANRRAQTHVILNDGVTRDLIGVGNDRVIADATIVRDVDVGHHEVVIPNSSDRAAERRAAMDGAELADVVVIADQQMRDLTGEF